MCSYEFRVWYWKWNYIRNVKLHPVVHSYSLSRGAHTHCAPHIHTMCTVRTVYMSNEVSAITQMLKIPLGPLSSRGSVRTGNYGFSSLGQILLLHKHCPRAGRVCISWKASNIYIDRRNDELKRVDFSLSCLKARWHLFLLEDRTGAFSRWRNKTWNREKWTNNMPSLNVEYIHRGSMGSCIMMSPLSFPPSRPSSCKTTEGNRWQEHSSSHFK